MESSDSGSGGENIRVMVMPCKGLSPDHFAEIEDAKELPLKFFQDQYHAAIAWMKDADFISPDASASQMVGCSFVFDCRPNESVLAIDDILIADNADYITVGFALIQGILCLRERVQCHTVRAAVHLCNLEAFSPIFTECGFKPEEIIERIYQRFTWRENR